ncbi:hypothetical protein DQ238_01130 [Geodermatophilus sp. TF02-6]|uniref:hypothetical protein n=1 Tax=Geodermatophilus sp. TF02-6 TaxID=2250575 RepID=UPI000DE92330|nr:hypothetical protein [Geodermatophilus sp. TF02-6]RBY83714.1 hypothetical protein DQ238_01130 [Geodermatophilus sp. TF02-6]
MRNIAPARTTGARAGLGVVAVPGAAFLRAGGAPALATAVVGPLEEIPPEVVASAAQRAG